MSVETQHQFLFKTLSETGALGHLSEHERQELAGLMVVEHFPEGQTVIYQGSEERDMFLILHGQARIKRSGTDLELIGPGQTFGDFALITAEPRTASVVAETDIAVARLSFETYTRLVEAEPRLGLRLVTRVCHEVIEQLVTATDEKRDLQRERARARAARVEVRVDDQRYRVPAGTPLGEFLPQRIGKHLVTAGLVDRRPHSLGWPIVADCSVAPMTTAHWEGRRVYRNSCALLLLEAAFWIDPGLGLRMEDPVGFGQRVGIHGIVPSNLNALALKLSEEMQRLARNDARLREQLWTVDEAQAHFAVAGWQAPAQLLKTWRNPHVPVASYGSVYAIALGPLLPNAGHIDGFRVMAEGDGLVLVFGHHGAEPGSPTHPETAAERRKRIRKRQRHMRVTAVVKTIAKQAQGMTSKQQAWLRVLDINSVGEFNQRCIGGKVSGLIQVAEGYQEKSIGVIADAIAQRHSTARVVSIAGPSSSGKTTFIKRLKVQMQVAGLRPVGLSLDDYYVDRELTPRDEDGEYDYEAFEALRVDLLSHHLERLFAGHKVQTAHYDFKTGKSHEDGGPLKQLEEGDVLMLEGIHGLNPKLVESAPPDSTFRVFVCPLQQLPFDNLSRVHASDVRLIRRIIRDRHGRGISAADNIARWPSVRRGERRHIFPFQENADAIFDSSLVYELAVLKVYAERYLLEVPQSHPGYTTAFRLLSLLDHFVPIYPNHVPPTSILREFIGGSGFEY